MSYRTNPDRILDNIDRSRSREAERDRFEVDRQAEGRDLESEPPAQDATFGERARRIRACVERAYVRAAKREQVYRLAKRFRAVEDLHHHKARGDVSIIVQYLDHERFDDVRVSPFEITPQHLLDARRETRTTQPDIGALKVLREQLKYGVLAAYRKLEPHIREAIKERADLGHVQVLVTLDLRPAG
ncbi:MAG: hypothetical protein J4G12_09700 [Gemmatimonadetes bacterium]|nr:hypothetical protein [Gemmatimonadota bacterium]